MKKKVFVAMMLDGLLLAIVLGFVYTVLFDIVLDVQVNLLTIVATIPVVMVLYALVPLIFKNASPGMRVMGVEILDESNQRPSFRVMLIRQLHFYAWCVSGFRNLKVRDVLTLGENGFDYKICYMGTRVAERKMHEKCPEPHRCGIQSFSPKTDYTSYRIPIIKAIIAAAVYAGWIILCVFVLMDAQATQQIPAIRFLPTMISVLVVLFDIGALMTFVGQILYVSEKKQNAM